MVTGEQFLEQLGSQFPVLREELREDPGLLHVQMHVFTRFTQAAIDAGDATALRDQFAFADRFFREAAPDLENAFYVSYLEDLDFIGPYGERAKELMPPALRRGWLEIMDYLAKLAQTDPAKEDGTPNA